MRLVILGTGNMASSHAAHFGAIDGVDIVGAVDLDAERAQRFAQSYDIPRTFTSLDEALDWGQFDSIANVTPDRFHFETSMKAIAAGKHVFCEKPLATHYGHAEGMADAAEAAGLVNMVNLTYRNVAELQKFRQLVDEGAIGEIKHVEASYLQSWLVSKAWGDWRTDPTWLWRLSTGHGSNGTLGDIGIHILDFASFGINAPVASMFCRLKAFDKDPDGRIGDYVLDANDSFTMSLEFGSGALGVVHATRWASGYLNTLRLRAYGDKGGLEVQHGMNGSSLQMCAGEDAEIAHWQEVPVEPVPTNYHRFVEAVHSGVNGDPSFRYAADMQKVLDLGFVSDQERKEIVVG
ncbi:Gfo/Idh/MocA family oxidoreductase [Pelagibacterium nitratireducens]|uniref:Gfo/Idh/MocA family oxidoreductase n=1 Tax=Pelagibacterium nitratireducens TaxID=1046114 RepID=A0ABZ2I6T1_9HYPH|nr:oxidoreductase [Pelagibacterium sp.]HCO53955.1 oxidoreductase [Pelagibacterium sp.]|tara:strand:+ start:3256 stop:4302 length:1047 start_codon:yes stop_codon:yes gene_type:complete